MYQGEETGPQLTCEEALEQALRSAESEPVTIAKALLVWEEQR